VTDRFAVCARLIVESLQRPLDLIAPAVQS
jgi:hypothetical protein